MGIMKLTVEIDLDWLSEDGSVDATVKEEIISRITGHIDKATMDSIKADAAKTASRQINVRINELLDGFLNGDPIIITDSYGDKKQQYENVREMMKERFDKFMSMPVDQNGKPTNSCNSGYGNRSYSNLEFLLDSLIKERFEEASKRIVLDTEAKIKKAIESTVKAQISDALLNKIDLPGLATGK